MVGFFIFTGLTSCNDSEPEPLEKITNPKQENKPIEKVSLDELVMKIEREQEGEVVLPYSRLVSSMKYYKESQYLILYFRRHSERAYIYKNVPVDVWEDFKSAESKGKYFGEKIRDVEDYQMIR